MILILLLVCVNKSVFIPFTFEPALLFSYLTVGKIVGDSGKLNW